MRLAGTWKQYSKKAIIQLITITLNSGTSRYFRWPYQAKVMKMLETVSSAIVRMWWDAPIWQLGNRVIWRLKKPWRVRRFNCSIARLQDYTICGRCSFLALRLQFIVPVRQPAG